VTNDRPRLADLSFAPSGNGRERATINGVEVVRENGRYWITTPNGPIWSNIDERGVHPALNYLFGKTKAGAAVESIMICTWLNDLHLVAVAPNHFCRHLNLFSRRDVPRRSPLNPKSRREIKRWAVR
jgi:hypothetical protein